MTEITITIQRKSQEPTPITGIALPEGTYKQIAHDYQATDGLIRIGMPSVLSMYLNQYSDLTESWQWFWFRQMIHAYTGYQHWDETRLTSTELSMLKAKWRSLTNGGRAFTNGKGTNDYKDYVSPNDLDGLPGQEPLVATGNIAKILGEPVGLSAKTWTPVETLDGIKPPPSISIINRLTRPDLIPSATTVPAIKYGDGSSTWTVAYLPDGTWRINPFPQLAPKHTPFILRTNGRDANALRERLLERGNTAPSGTYTRDGVYYAVNYIRTDRLIGFVGSVVPNPFNPAQ